ncbi:MAG: hypothetical protein SVR94_15880 [Pseudomonadota bacterium]|nr:hypothetical protein [Pseudomonadota bacterium]
MPQKKFLLLGIVFSVLLLLAGCSAENTYQGRVIEVDFRNSEDVKDEAWIEVDGIRYTHYENFVKSKQDEYSLPASKQVYYIVKKDNSRERRFSPVSDFAIAIRLGNYIDLSHTKRDTTLARVKIGQRYLMMTYGKLILQRPDSTRFTVMTSPNYSAEITVKSS